MVICHLAYASDLKHMECIGLYFVFMAVQETYNLVTGKAEVCSPGHFGPQLRWERPPDLGHHLKEDSTRVPETLD